MNTFSSIRLLATSFLFAVTLAASEMPVAPSGSPPTGPNPFPLNVQNALLAATKGTLYSIQPGPIFGASTTSLPTFHDFTILGQLPLDAKQLPAVIAAFQAAATEGTKMNGAAMCFNPRHGLSVTVNGHTYDFVLCYECSRLYIYEDNKQIAAMNAVGSPKVLNDLLSAAKVPISGPSQAQLDAEAKKGMDAKTKFRAAAPKSLLALWDSANQYGPGPSTETARAALKKEIPDTTPRVRALLGYYGAGGGPWNEFGAYEVQAINLLMDYTGPEIATALQAGPLSDAQLEGAARWLTGYRYAYLPDIPTDIQARLLSYVLKNGDDRKVALAKQLLSPPPAAVPAASAASSAK